MPRNDFRCCLLQLLKSAGILNLPEWFDAGRVAQQSTFAPFSEWLLCARQLPSWRMTFSRSSCWQS